MEYKEYLGGKFACIDLEDAREFAARKGLAKRKNWMDLAITMYLEHIIGTYGRFCVPDMYVYEIKKRFTERDYRLHHLTVYVRPSSLHLI